MRRSIFSVSITLIIVAALFLVAASPIALRFLAATHRFNWHRLSDVGQTYGAVSAILAVIGLSGVATTIILQLQESRHSRLQIIRTRHYDLARIALDHPALAHVSHGVGKLPTVDERRQAVYINLEIQFWLMLWQLNSLKEESLRVYVSDLFETAAGKRYWQAFGRSRTSLETVSKGERRFFQIVNDEYQRLAAVASEPHGQRRMSHRRMNNSVVAAALAGFVGGAALGGVLIRRANTVSSSNRH